MKKTVLHTTLASILALTATMIMAAGPQEKVERSNQYIDSSRDGYLSGWKAMLTNSQPNKLLFSGIWFEPSKKKAPFSQGVLEPFTDEIKSRLVDNSTDGLLVIKDNTVVKQYLRYGFNIDDIHLIHSTGKAFTSFAIQPIYDQIGKDGLDTPLSSYLPKLKGLPVGQATLQHALDMQAGLEWSENYDDPNTHSMLSGL
ncbi:serine hydrolase [Photobacterium sanguinicancri]|uniref:serine hydrolase n=1 Tax=Photobacterium sanguinicancri TaxID=875932 RepID=UPI000AC6759A|nr:serine hydrolase [Photobacterium sanguinicancri]